MQKGEDSKLSKQEMIQAQLEAQQALMSLSGLGISIWFRQNGWGWSAILLLLQMSLPLKMVQEPICWKLLNIKVINLWINPTEYLYLIRDKAQLFIYDGLDFKRIPVLDDLLKDQTKSIHYLQQ